jgi:hypothetical protein
MRTKALFVAAAFGAAGLVSSMAQVYSVNVVGYVNTTLVPGFSLISNPLDAASNSVADLMPPVDNLTVYKFTDGAYQIASYFEALEDWDGQLFDINPGEGAFVLNPTAEPVPVTFVGEITEGNKSIAIPAGFSIRSSIVPQTGALGELAWPLADNDQVFKFNRANQAYEIYAYFEALEDWDPSEPVIEVGEAFFVNKPAAATWSRNFSVGQ